MKNSKEAKFVYADEEERILMVETDINNKKTLLVAIYAPNKSQEKFYEELCKVLIEKDYQHICLIGNFNAIMDETTDN